MRYQIFVSSTYEDLRDERDQVIKTIWEMGDFAVGMEMFSAADEKQWKTIQREIDQTDYYIVIIAHKYGLMDGPISYTEKEYNYALERGIPILGFVIDDQAEWPTEKRDRARRKVKALRLFKERVKQKPVSTWKNTEELARKVAIALNKQMRIAPRPGWVRALDVPSNKEPGTGDVVSIAQEMKTPELGFEKVRLDWEAALKEHGSLLWEDESWLKGRPETYPVHPSNKDSLWAILAALRRGEPTEVLHRRTGISVEVLQRLNDRVDMEKSLLSEPLTQELLLRARNMGFSFDEIGILADRLPEQVREFGRRRNLPIDTFSQPDVSNLLFLSTLDIR